MSIWISGNFRMGKFFWSSCKWGIHFLKWIITKEKVKKWCFICLLVGSTNIFLSIYRSQGWDRCWTGRWTGSFCSVGLSRMDNTHNWIMVLSRWRSFSLRKGEEHTKESSTSKQYYETPILKVSSSTLNLQKLEVIKTHPSIVCGFLCFFFSFWCFQSPFISRDQRSIVCGRGDIPFFWDITFLVRKNDSSRGVGIP